MDNDERPKTPSLNGDDTMTPFQRPVGRRLLWPNSSHNRFGEKRARKRKDRKTLKRQFEDMNERRANRRNEAHTITKEEVAKAKADDYRPKTPSLGDNDSAYQEMLEEDLEVPLLDPLQGDPCRVSEVKVVQQVEERKKSTHKKHHGRKSSSK